MCALTEAVASNAVRKPSIHIANLVFLPRCAIRTGPAITGLTVIAGYLAFDRLLSGRGWLQGIVVTGAALLAFWGLLQLSQARAIAVTQTEANPQSPQSYVDDSSGNTPEPTPPQDDSSEKLAREELRDAWVKIMLSADLMLGILLGNFVQLKIGEDYTAW